MFTLLYSNPPLPSIQWLSLVRKSDTECWACCSNWVIPKSLEQGPRLFCRQNRGPRQVSGLNARVRAGPRLFCPENRALRERILEILRSAQVRAEFAEEIVVRTRFLGKCSGSQLARRFCREHRAPCWFLKMLRSAGSRFRSARKQQQSGPLHASRCGEMQISA